MKIKSYLKRGITSMYLAIQRFPITIGMTSLVSFFLIFLVHQGSSLDPDTLDQLQRVTMVLALGIPLSLCIKRILEIKSPSMPFLFYLVGIGLLVGYYLLFLKDMKQLSMIRYTAITLALYLAFIFLPYGSDHTQDFELYTIQLGGRFFLTVIYTLVLFLGLAGILFTVDQLLGVTVTSKPYLDVWIGSVGIFAPAFFLAGVPKLPLSKISFSYPHAFKVLLLYIVMPLLTAYTAILYLFFAKILITHQWPNGLVAHLVLWYSIITTIVLFCIDTLRTKNKWAKTFYFWMSKLILPILVIMFVSIGIRIQAYGVTSNRYFVVLAGLWVTGSMLYLAFVKKPKTIWLLISLSCLSFLSVWGPWSHAQVSLVSQNHRLEKILTQNGMIQEGRILLSTTISPKDQVEISQILSYLEKMDSLKKVRSLPLDFTLEKMDETFGFSYQSAYASLRKYFYYSTMGEKPFPMAIGDYDYFMDFRNYYFPAIYTSNLGEMEISYEAKTTEIVFLEKGREIYRRKVSDFGKQLYEKYGINEKGQLPLEEMTFYDENERLKIAFVLSNVHGDAEQNDVTINEVGFYILVQIK